MRTEEVLANLESYSLWEYGGYKLSREEHKVIVEDLKTILKLRKWRDQMKKGAKADESIK